MPLFSGARDISLFEKLNEELINSVIQTEIYFYKLVLDETGDNVYGFLRKEFTKISLVPEVGDIIEWDKAYFEIDSMVDNQIVGGKDPDYSLAGGMHGSSHSIICTTHMTRMSRLNIEDVRYGNEPSDYSFPKGI